MTSNDFSDELFESMMPAGAPTPASTQLREAVLAQTTRTIRGRRRMRHARLGAMLVACYLGGIATMSLWSGRSAEWVASGSDHSSESDAQRLVRPEDDQVVNVNPRPAARLTPYERFCRDGDQQLAKNDDIRAAARSYKKALQLASAEQRSIAPDRDTWLLMAMKQSNN